ncbi:MAG: DMT family protein [Bacteroidales bacterium]|nr:DMT family protein [Bacteroidales bacterium]
MARYIIPIVMLVISNIFMTIAWYGHLKLQKMNIITDHTPLYVVILISWLMALIEYAFQVPANRMGFIDNGGPFNLMQLKIIQEVITLAVFTIYTMFIFGGQTLQWNHVAAFVCLIMAVVFVFWK